MSENKRFLEGCEKLDDGRYRIHEKTTVTPIKCKEPITEKIIVEGKEVSPKRKYTFLVWKKDIKPRDGTGENGNLRNYSDVIDRVIEENRPTFTLADHPQDGCEADSVRITGCGKNYRMIDNWLATDWYPLGEIGNRLADGFDLGVPATISSSVLGTLDDDGYVVNDSSFFLERILDNLIDFPSNGVYHYADHNEHMNDDYSFETISENGFKESTQKENLTILDKQNITESAENTQNDKAVETESDDSIGEEKMPENTNDELIQQSMMLNIKSMIKDAENMDSPFDKKDALVSADSFAKKLTDDTLHVEICKKIEDTDNEIKELSAKGLQTDDLANKCKALEDENKKVSDELEALKAEKADIEEKLKTVTNMYEEEQYKCSQSELDKTEELEEKNHRLSKELCSLKAKNRNLEGMMKRNRRVLESKMNKLEAEANTLVDADVVVDCKKKIKKLECENADLCKKIEDLEDTIDSMKKANDAIDAEANVEEILALKRAVEQLTAKNNRLRRALNESKAEKEEVKKTRFSTLKKEMDEDDEVIVDDELINDEVDNVVVDDGQVVVAEEEDDDSDDELMERMLRGEVK
jgi:hypothetical protein